MNLKVKLQIVPLQIIVTLLKQQPFRMTEDEMKTIVERTDGYSGADVANLCKEAALGPIRSLQVYYGISLTI